MVFFVTVGPAVTSQVVIGCLVGPSKSGVGEGRNKELRERRHRTWREGGKGWHTVSYQCSAGNREGGKWGACS